MRAEYVNAFVTPAAHVIRLMSGLEVHRGEIRRIKSREEGPKDLGFSIIIGVKGGLAGSVILSASIGVARALCAAIDKSAPEALGEQDIREIMAEVANTIVGNATGELFELGIKAGITPPTVVLGEKIGFCFDAGSDTLLVPVLTDLGEIYLTVSFVRDTL